MQEGTGCALHHTYRFSDTRDCYQSSCGEGAPSLRSRPALAMLHTCYTCAAMTLLGRDLR